jgi:Mrp family chromosome partitioning ATPase
VLRAGCSLATPYEVLTLPRLGALLEEARRGYDWVIVDAPPLVPLADCQYVGKWVDGFLVVVAAHETPRALLAEALNSIDPAKLVGLAFNKDERQAARYSSYRSPRQSSGGHHRGRRHARQRRAR